MLAPPLADAHRPAARLQELLVLIAVDMLTQIVYSVDRRGHHRVALESRGALDGTG